MTGRAEVARLKTQLDATFRRVKELEVSPELEVRSDFARYLCVLVSGYLEKSMTELVVAHATSCGPPTLVRFVERRTRRFTNANAQRLKELVGTFNPEWQKDMDSFLVDELKEAVDSVLSLRHRIAHGGTIGVTYQRISEYYLSVQKVVDHVAGLLDIH